MYYNQLEILATLNYLEESLFFCNMEGWDLAYSNERFILFSRCVLIKSINLLTSKFLLGNTLNSNHVLNVFFKSFRKFYFVFSLLIEFHSFETDSFAVKFFFHFK